MKLNNTFAIGCLIQWYEIELIEEYLQSVKSAVDTLENKKNVIIEIKKKIHQPPKLLFGSEDHQTM